MRRRQQLISVIRERQMVSERGVVLLASQVAADFIQTCEHLIVLRDGGTVFQGLITDLSETGDDLESRLEEVTLGGRA
jgi:ABC-type multidrug transport system ATPase subunit